MAVLAAAAAAVAAVVGAAEAVEAMVTEEGRALAANSAMAGWAMVGAWAEGVGVEVEAAWAPVAATAVLVDAAVEVAELEGARAKLAGRREARRSCKMPS